MAMKTKNTETTKVETRGRKFDVETYVDMRSLEIARNAEVSHNTNPINVAKHGLVKQADFMEDALIIAKREAEAKSAKQTVKMYKLITVTKKNQLKILASIDLLIEAKKSVNEYPTNEELATEIFRSRFGTGASRSTNRHMLHALADISESGVVPKALKEKEIVFDFA